jgi:predicted nucleic acid-binding Zn ribbon protein
MSLGDAINKFLEQHGLKDDLLIQTILTEWEAYMGKSIASNTEKVWFEKGTLYIKMASPVWRNELMMGRQKIKEMINRKVQKDLVDEVKIL